VRRKVELEEVKTGREDVTVCVDEPRKDASASQIHDVACVGPEVGAYRLKTAVLTNEGQRIPVQRLAIDKRGPVHARVLTTASVNMKTKRPIETNPFRVKKAISTFDKSSGFTRLCS